MKESGRELASRREPRKAGECGRAEVWRKTQESGVVQAEDESEGERH